MCTIAIHNQHGEQVGNGVVIDSSGLFLTAKHVLNKNFLHRYYAIVSGDKVAIRKTRLLVKDVNFNCDIDAFELCGLNLSIEPIEILPATSGVCSAKKVSITAGENAESEIHLQTDGQDVIHFQSDKPIKRGMSGCGIYSAGKLFAILSGTSKEDHRAGVAIKAAAIWTKYSQLVFAAPTNQRLTDHWQLQKDQGLKLGVYLQDEISNYTMHGDPFRSYFKLSSCLDSVSVPSIELVQVNIFLAYILINSSFGEQAISTAQKHLESAQITLESMPFNRFNIDLLIRIKWLSSICYKQVGCKDVAYDMCDKALSEFSKGSLATPSQCFVFEREKFVLSSSSGKVFIDAFQSNSLPIDLGEEELFFSIRRVFQHNVQNQRIDKATQLLGSLKRSYRAISDTIYPVYKVGLSVDLYRYYRCLEDYGRARQFRTFAAKHAKRLNLLGELKKVVS